MLTPQELYYLYSTEPCENEVGRGTPYDLKKLANFLKQLKYPCYTRAPHTQTSSEQGILNSGSGKIALPFKFLQRLDVEAFSEIQPNIKSGTSHAIRNACDIMRACFLEASNNRLLWDYRGATEYMQFFGDNSLTDCLMMLGPDLVPENQAMQRGTGCNPIDCLPGKLPRKSGVALGAEFSCKPVPGTMNQRECTSCDDCEAESDDPNPSPCCKANGCEGVVNACCGDTPGTRTGVWDYSNIFNENNTDKPLKHIGLLKRKSYGGYANFINNSGPNFYACPGDIFLKYFQTLNEYDYSSHAVKKIDTSTLSLGTETIGRARTISILSSGNTQQIKDLLYNGYGVVLMTNVGFPNKRDSSGLSYPDRIWYHTYTIIGYDDRKTEYDECVYLLANSWGPWNSGGHPSWGPIPEGSFLVTESHLSCMIRLFRADQQGCRTKTTISGGNITTELGCFSGEGGDDSCSPWICDKRQRVTGIVFGLSLVDGFPKQNLDYLQFYQTRRKL